MTKLTDFQAWAITNAIATWDAKNKASEKPVLDLELFKKLFAIRSTLRDTYEAVGASGILVAELYKEKKTTDYNLNLLSESDFKKMVSSVEEYEVFSWITDGLST